MRYPALALLLFCMFLYGCTPAAVEAEYVLSDGDSAWASWIENDHLAVLLLPQTVVDGYAAFAQLDPAMAAVNLVGLASSSATRIKGGELAAFGGLAVTLAVTAKGVEEAQVDAQLCLEALTDGAPYLRKTLLADTLASITGRTDPFGVLETVKQATVFDMRTSLALSQNTDWEHMKAYLRRYVEEIRRFQRKE